MYTVDGTDCHVILNVDGSGFSWIGESGELENDLEEPDMVRNLCNCCLGSSPLIESRLRGEFLTRANGCCLLLAIGNDSPRNLPRLATPTPHVNVVLYPAQSFPPSKHGVQ